MLYYKTKDAASAAKLAERLADRKNDFIIWTQESAALSYDRRGTLVSEENSAVHFDALDVRQDMTDAEIKNAHRIAAGRQTIRTKEERAAALLQNAAVLSAEGRRELLALVNVGYHSGGSKIDGCYSIDSCAACAFCQSMIRAALDNILIICGACYAARDAWKEISWRTHKLNAEILSRVLFTVEELAALAIGELCRFNEDGDTVNETMARNYLRIAASHAGTHFGYWYKNAPAVEAGLKAEGITTRDALPENVRFIHSSALIGFPARPLWFDDAVFTVYPDDVTTAAAIAAGAWECNGRKCRACGYTCYLMQRRGDVLQIAEYLRCGKAERARIMAAYIARKAQESAA